MHLGLSTYTYSWAIGVPGHQPENPMTLFQLIDLAFKHHLKVIQIADNRPLHLLSEEELDQLLAYSKDKEISIEVGTRGMTIQNVSAYLSIAKRLHSDILRIVIDGSGFEPSVDEVIKILKEIIPLLKVNNIRLSIENHDRFKSYEFAKMITETDPEWVGICLDSVNSMGAGEGIEEVVRTLAPFTINLHLKEFVIRRVSHKMGFVVEGLPAGEGMLNIPSLLETIEKTGKCKSAILELWTPPSETLEETIRKENEWAELSIENLKKLKTIK
jgi:sugar phosphate isomerase/epimerase